ncbi:phosphatidate cytidylyltransferase [Blastomonas sp.]|uniref:phosphatidate cytidylyltransferase n=1 Tax=Blastomonas sp. TaxID=1909299 RepID=UPI002603256E|nr:phosphatidate cytidylyltransferase [Blastomonas sp.]MDM7957736.1 phosphatidate cytidylyltransferase [Blastomonas sp.]
MVAAEPGRRTLFGNDLAVRTGSGVVLVVIAGVALWLGGIAFWLLLMAGALTMQHEWAGLVGRLERRRLAMLALMAPLSMLSPFADGPGFLSLGFILGGAFFIAAIDRSFRLAWGVLYCALPVMALLYLRQQDNGLLLAVWTMATVWATDIGAYFAGRGIGGPKIAPSISPSKTWAGLAGGMVAALVFALVLRAQFDLPYILVLASAPLAAVAQMGDFLESWMKRQAGVKDSGALIPGHGGILDRVDGLVPVAPVVALLVAGNAFWALG